jgi:hypothetical protein
MTIDTPAPEPCSTVYCQTMQKYVRELEAALNKSLALNHTSCIDINDADVKMRPAPQRVEMCAIVTRFVMPPCREASS